VNDLLGQCADLLRSPQLSVAGFSALMTRALNALHKRGKLLVALQTARDTEVGVARGSSLDLCRWMNRLMPGTQTYSPELSVLTR